jgi:TPR repeat protein
MITRASLEALVGRDLSGLLRGLACVLALAAMCFSRGAAAGVLGAGERAYARHDYVRAAPLLLAEAERGSPIAQTYIGYMFQNGLGVPRDYSAAAGWLNLAAQQGAPTAQFLLGLLFDKGYGVPQDWVQAEVWLNLAASQASPRQRGYWAQIRDSVAQKLTLDQLAEAQLRAYAWAPIAVRSAAPVTARY